MARQRIAVLYEIWWSEEEPEPQRTRKKRKSHSRKKEVHEEVYETLRKLGYQPFYQVLDGEPESLLKLGSLDASLIFNLTESYAGDDTKDMNIAAYLDLLGKPYTGSSAHALHLAQDKALAKKVLGFHGIRTPYFAVSYRGKTGWADDISFPLIVKPQSEDGSIGIDTGSVVRTVKELMERIDYIHSRFDSAALIEEYIEGREIYAAVVGNVRPEALPLVELDLSRVPESIPKIAGTEVKWLRETKLYRVTKPFFPEDIPPETEKRLKETAVAAYQALKCRDYARVDMRLREDGTVHVLEVNPNPWLVSFAEFSMAWKRTGRSYAGLIQQIVNMAFARYAEPTPVHVA
ncbi:MAG: D-alanine--D-alanine ligase [Acidobacteriota bacterium]